jgi:transcriptional regulator
MFVPGMYRAPDPRWTRAIVRGCPLALVATSGPAAPYATHAPVIIPDDTEANYSANLVGTRLMGHLNRANPHWQALQSGGEALLVFSGPNGYVSPTIYGFEPAAPTWDFAAVHLRGAVTPIRDREASLDVVVATVRAFEARFGENWNPASSLDYFRKILPAVGAFSVEVSSVEAMFKLSQEQTAQTREQVAEAFAASGEPMHCAIAGLIAALGDRPIPAS